MYNCQNCGTTVPARTAAYRLVVETRVKKYPNGSTGLEIARELLVCEKCNKELQPAKEAVAAA